MFKKLIVGVDGREAGSDAVALARTLAAPDTEIILVNAYPYDSRMIRGSLNGYQELLRGDAMDILRKEGDDPRFERRTVPDVSPARALHEEAKDEAADLIVIGSCHRGVLGRVLVGDVSRAVLHGAMCPVVVAPRGYREHPKPVKVLGVGTNQGGPARAAVDFAASMASDAGAELRLLTAIRLPVAFTPGYAYSYDWPQLAEEDHKAAELMLSEMVAALDVPATSVVVDGIPAEELEKLSRDVDLLVLGSRGWGAVRRVVLGSTADRVVHNASCPVIVVPTPAEERVTGAGEERLAQA